MHLSRVLIVEDDVDLRDALGQLFAHEGYEVVTAANGGEGIELLEAGPLPCAVIADLLMPGIVGHELLDYMREDATLSAIPVAIISGSPQLAPEGYPVFPKPLDAPALMEFVTARCPVNPGARRDHAPSGSHRG